MNVQFATEELERLYSTPQSELRGKQRLPQQVITQYKKLVTLLLALAVPEDLRQFRGLRYERKTKGAVLAPLKRSVPSYCGTS